MGRCVTVQASKSSSIPVHAEQDLNYQVTDAWGRILANAATN